MELKFVRCIVDEKKCRKCGFCIEVNSCHSPQRCSGCLSCYWACPYEARIIVEDFSERKNVRITVNGVEHEVPEYVTVKQALKLVGYSFPKEVGDFCETGGCWSCAVIINGNLERSCITPIANGMTIETDVENVEPLRIIHGPQPHTVGGKATPWSEKKKGRYVEVAIWTAGCNLRCPQCQNYYITYDNVSSPLTPREAAKIMTYYRRIYRVNGLAVSGGEPTLNRRWLIQYFKELNKLNPDPEARLHLDSNGTVLTPDYIDYLVEVGCNNIGVEPKGARIETFMKITGIRDKELAERYLQTSWNAVKYIADNYADRVYLGIGIPYNPALISLEEVCEIGYRIASIDPEIQVCVLDYFPTFRRRDIKRPPATHMVKIKKILNEIGLKYVIVQTSMGHIGP